METVRSVRPSAADLELLVGLGRGFDDVVDVTDALALPGSTRPSRTGRAPGGSRVVRARLEALRLDPATLAVERVVVRVELALRGSGEKVSSDAHVHRRADSNAAYRRVLDALARGPLAGAVDDPGVVHRVLSGAGGSGALHSDLATVALLGELEDPLDDVVRVLTALADGVPPEWALRHAAGSGAGR